MEKPFKFKKGRAKHGEPPPGKPTNVDLGDIDADPPIGVIQGMTPGSIEEWRVALALQKLGYKFNYQIAIDSTNG